MMQCITFEKQELINGIKTFIAKIWGSVTRLGLSKNLVPGENLILIPLFLSPPVVLKQPLPERFQIPGSRGSDNTINLCHEIRKSKCNNEISNSLCLLKSNCLRFA